MVEYQAMSHERVGLCWCSTFHRLEEMQLVPFCPHDDLVGGERPVLEMGRFPVLWSCTVCGALQLDDEYKEVR